MAPTIRDVARLAKVSPSTVSAVINQKGYVSKDTLKRVNAAINKLDYTPQRSARDLAKRTSGNLGFIVSDTHFSRAEPFYTRVFLGAEIEARNHDLYVLLTSVPKKYKEQKHLPRFLRERNVDGVMIAGNIPDKLIRDVLARDIPTVFVDYGNDRFPGAKVLIDNRRGVLEAVRHLISLGHEKIGFIGAEPDHPSVRERLEGFREGLKEKNLNENRNWVIFAEGDMNPDRGADACLMLLENSQLPTALVCANDAMATGVLNVLKDIGIAVPGVISVVGFDDVPTCTILDPPLTTVRVHKEDLGAIAVQTLVDLISRRYKQSKVIREGVEMIIRESTGIAHNGIRKI